VASEIERKFRLAGRPPWLRAAPSRRIEQGYLAVSDDGVEVRIRRAGSATTLTVKSGSGLVRVEEELEIDGRRFDALWRLTEGRRVVKTRHLVPLAGGLTAEVDEYAGALQGLWTAEVEFDSEEASGAFAPPDWLGDEVTGDERFANRTLALAAAPPPRG
jgi:CYTH domain-containing protein